jgi:alpha-tubulin suppressor-like RCC1 family protein
MSNWPLGIVSSAGGGQAFIGMKLYGVGRDGGSLGTGDSGVPNRSSLIQVGVNASGDFDPDLYDNIDMNVSPTDNHGLIKNDGSLWTWGNKNGFMAGSSGAVDEPILRPTPTLIDSDPYDNFPNYVIDKKGVSLIYDGGKLFTSGMATEGGKGDTTSGTRYSPVQIATGITNWKNVFRDEGNNNCIAITDDGKAYAWGSNTMGQLGINTILNTSVPTQIGTDTNWLMFNLGDTFTFGIKTNGTMWAFGQHGEYRLGVGSSIAYEEKVLTPMQVGSASDWVHCSLSGDGGFALKSDGTLHCWGEAGGGFFGDNMATGTANRTPIQMGSDSDWYDISCGKGQVAVAIKENGTAWAWGNDTYGQHGMNTYNVSRSVPTQIGTDNHWHRCWVATAHTFLGKQEEATNTTDLWYELS